MEGNSRASGNRSPHSKLDPDELGQRVRQLAIDAHQILTQPDPQIDEVVGLRRRLRVLLRETREAPATEINRWLQSAWQAIEAKLQSGSREDLELSAT